MSFEFFHFKTSRNTVGVCPDLHFHHLPGTQIYTTHIYTKPTVTQHQIYMGSKFTRTPIFITSNLHNPILHKPKYTQPQNNTKPNFTQKQFTQVPILRNQGTRYFLSLFLAVQTFSPDKIAGFLDIYIFSGTSIREVILRHCVC